jgi:hypothetical protein
LVFVMGLSESVEGQLKVAEGKLPDVSVERFVCECPVCSFAAWETVLRMAATDVAGERLAIMFGAASEVNPFETTVDVAT